MPDKAPPPTNFDLQTMLTGLGITENTPEIAKGQIYTCIQEFYRCPSVYNAQTAEQSKEFQTAELAIANQVGVNLDLLAISYLAGRELIAPEHTFNVISPLRGGTSVTEDSKHKGVLALQEKGIPVKLVNIGISRNGPEATQYYPVSKDFAYTETDIVVIKDMGIATGGTGRTAAEDAIAAGAKPENVVIVGAIGTDRARNHIAEGIVEAAGRRNIEITIEQALSQIHFAVEGQMPCEEDSQYSEDRHDKYYITKIRASNSDEWVPIPPKDWGDKLTPNVKTVF